MGQKILYSSYLNILESFAVAIPNYFMSWVYSSCREHKRRQTTASVVGGVITSCVDEKDEDKEKTKQTVISARGGKTDTNIFNSKLGAVHTS